MSKSGRFVSQKHSVVTAVIIASGILLVGYFLHVEFGGSGNHTIITEQQLEADREAGIRRQKATFTPQSLGVAEDEDWSWAVIEVGVKTLEKPEGVEHRFIDSMARTRGRSYKYGNATNLIVWNKVTGESRLLFSDRLELRAVRYFGDSELDYILVIARPTDGKANNLYFYQMAQNEMAMIDLQGYLLVDFAGTVPIDGDYFSLVSLGIDQNGDGRFNNQQEITIPLRFDPDTKSLIPIASQDIYNKAQIVLDGH